MPLPDRNWQEEEEESTGIWRWLSYMPIGAFAACCLYIPGVVLWAVFAIRTKDDTAAFFNTVAPVSSSTLDAATNALLTTLITLIVGCSLIFVGAFALAVARSVQTSGLKTNSCCPCANPTPSSYYLYSTFNLGFNTIIFLVNLAIVFLLMGAFMWLVVAYAANQAIKHGVRDAASLGTSPLEQLLNATRNLTTVVTLYEHQIEEAPRCISNTTWLKDLNRSINGILRHPNDSSLQSTVLCPYTCLNLGSFATLFKLPYNCICDQDKLETMESTSAAISTEAGVALGGLILIYFACCTLHANLTAQFVHARKDFQDSLKARRRRHGGSSAHSSDDPEEGGRHGKGPSLHHQSGARGGPGSSRGTGDQLLAKTSSRGPGGSSGAAVSSRRQVAPQQPGAAPGPVRVDRRPSGKSSTFEDSAGMAVGAGDNEGEPQASGSPSAVGPALRRELAVRSDGDHSAARMQLAAAGILSRPSYRAQPGSGAGGGSGSGGASPRTGCGAQGDALWLGPLGLGEGGAAGLWAEAAPMRPRHQAGGSAGSARDILMGKVALEGASNFGAAVAARAVHRTTTSASASSSVARHTPSSSQESVSGADSPRQGPLVGLSGGANSGNAAAAAAWHQQRSLHGTGSGPWQTIEGHEGGAGSAVMNAMAGGVESPTRQAHQPPPLHPQQQQQQQRHWQPDGRYQLQRQLWEDGASSSSGAPAPAAAAALVGLSPQGPLDPSPAPSPMLSTSIPSPWRPSSSGSAGAGGGGASAVAPRGSAPGRHHHSLSASLPVGGTLSEWAEVHEPAPSPLYSPSYYGAGSGSMGYPHSGSTPATPNGGAVLAGGGGMPSVMESGGSTASSDTGRPGSSDQSHLMGAPPSPLTTGEGDRLRGGRNSMRKGVMVHDHYQYKQRQQRRTDPAEQQQQQQQQPVDPRIELFRRYRNRVPAI